MQSKFIYRNNSQHKCPDMLVYIIFKKFNWLIKLFHKEKIFIDKESIFDLLFISRR